MDLVVGTEAHRGWSVVSAKGELDLNSSPVLSDEISRALDGDGPAVAIDLTDVTFMDSTGLGVLVTSLKRAKLRGGELTLIGANGAPLKVLALTGMTDGVFPMVETTGDLTERP